MPATKPADISFFEYLKDAPMVITVSERQALEAIMQQVIPGVKLVYEGTGNLPFEELRRAALAQRENDRTFTQDHVIQLIDSAYNPAAILAMLPGLKRADEPRVREATKEGVIAGIEKFLKKTHQPCCIFHSDTEWFAEDRAVKYQVERRVRLIDSRVSPAAYATNVSAAVLTSVQTYRL